jgi:hypothetical protein
MSSFRTHNATSIKVKKVTVYTEDGTLSYRGLAVDIFREGGTDDNVFIFTDRPVNSGVIEILADEIIGTPAPVDYAGFVQVPPPPVDPDYCFDPDPSQEDPKFK